MTRLDFTKNICSLILEMVAQGERPILDWVKRSYEEQQRMVEAGLSKTLDSKHLQGKAADIYFLSEDGSHLIEPLLSHEYWHDVWMIHYGGKPMIEWDAGHYE